MGKKSKAAEARKKNEGDLHACAQGMGGNEQVGILEAANVKRAWCEMVLLYLIQASIICFDI